MRGKITEMSDESPQNVLSVLLLSWWGWTRRPNK